jgi:hypothetical protein
VIADEQELVVLERATARPTRERPVHDINSQDTPCRGSVDVHTTVDHADALSANGSDPF